MLLPVDIFPSNNNFFGKLFGSKEKTEKKDKKREIKNPEDLYDLSLEENITNIDYDKYASQIRSYQRNQAVMLKKSGYRTELMRDGLVVVVSIPARDLFNQNDTVLKPESANILTTFVNYLNKDDLFRVLIVMHSDNTGTKEYTSNLTKIRVEKVFDWFDKNTVNTEYLIPYAVGEDMPLKPNNSLYNRDYNRRLEIYLIPGSKMVNMAKKGKL